MMPSVRDSLGQTNAGDRHSHVAILLATYNGARYLAEQIESIRLQDHEDWCIHASDDASSDDTLRILEHYQALLGTERMRIYTGPARGFFRNFLSLALNQEISANFFAFCDQDDIWHPDKLSRAVNALINIPDGVPGLYCSRTRLIDETGAILGDSHLFDRSPSFANALIQSLAGGNTMVFNPDACALLRAAGDLEIVAHDWWLYMLVTGCDGVVIYDARPTVDYRQHTLNLIGSNTRLRDRLFRLRRLLQGGFRDWNSCNVQALNSCSSMFSAQNRAILEEFSASREAGMVGRVRGFVASGVYRQSRVDYLLLLIAAALKRV